MLCSTLNSVLFQSDKATGSGAFAPECTGCNSVVEQLYTAKPGAGISKFDGVDLNVPLTYADRFEIRQPGPGWNFNLPHIDGR